MHTIQGPDFPPHGQAVGHARQCIGHVSYVLTSVGIRDLWEVANQPQLTTRERDSLRLVLAEIESSRAERPLILSLLLLTRKCLHVCPPFLFSLFP